MIESIKHTQFVEKVLGIRLTPQETCLLLEGRNLHREDILLEIAIYEGFLDDLAAKIGGVPKTIAKTLTDAGSVLTFMYNVIADKTGQNLSKAIAILMRNSRVMFAKIERAIQQVPQKVKELFTQVIDWIREKTKSVLAVQSDTDATDKISGDSSNWKKFILLLLIGMLLVFLKQVPAIVKGFGEDTVNSGLEQVWTLTKDTLTKFMSAPADLAKLVAGGGIIKTLLPIIGIYKSAKLLANVNNDLLDSNAWLKKLE